LRVKQLWIAETHRGRGLGRSLLETAVVEASARDCRLVWVMTYDFQAPGLYERCGFERVAELLDWPPGHTHIILRLHLAGIMHRADGSGGCFGIFG
jgi:ribosomal protein S18 acetylase RimI-like enzyme